MGRKHRAWRDGVDGFSVALIAGASVLHLLPHAIEHGGRWAVLAAVVGFAVPTVLRRWSPFDHVAWPALGLVLLAIHAAFDGTVLAVAATPLGAPLALAIAAHRIPVGLAVFDVASRRSRATAWGAIFALCALTVAGFAAGALAPTFPDVAHAVLEALITGALLQAVFDPHGHEAFVVEHHHHDPAPVGLPASHDHDHHGSTHHDPSKPTVGGPIGGTFGLLFVGAFTALSAGSAELHHVRETGSVFLQLALQSAPSLLLGLLLAGVASAIVIPPRARWLAGPIPAVRGVLFGLPLPVRSCGVMPLFHSLTRAHVPAAATVAFLVATPLLGLDALAMSMAFLGLPFTILRVASAVLVAVLAATAVSSSATPPVLDERPADPDPLPQRLVDGLRYAFGELVDHTLPWVLAGLAATALLSHLISPNAIASVPPVLQVPLAALLGGPLYVSAAAATPIGAAGITNGLSSGAAMAFLLTAPTANIATFALLSKLHSRAFALRFAAALLTTSVAIGWAMNIAGAPGLSSLPTTAAPGALQTASLVFLMILGIVSLFRQRPRGVVEQFLEPIHA